MDACKLLRLKARANVAEAVNPFGGIDDRLDWPTKPAVSIVVTNTNAPIGAGRVSKTPRNLTGKCIGEAHAFP